MCLVLCDILRQLPKTPNQLFACFACFACFAFAPFSFLVKPHFSLHLLLSLLCRLLLAEKGRELVLRSTLPSCGKRRSVVLDKETETQRGVSLSRLLVSKLQKRPPPFFLHVVMTMIVVFLSFIRHALPGCFFFFILYH